MTLKIKKPIGAIYLKCLLIPICSILFIILLMIFSKTAISSAKKGIDLWLNIVFPSLFPFFVASYLLNSSGFIRAVGILFEPIMWPLFKIPGCGSFALALGITSGYPMGAVITTGLREQNLITKNEAERLLAFTNNSGPLFIVGSVATGMLKNSILGYYLLGCHIIASLTVGILLGLFRRKKTNNKVSKIPLMKKFKKELYFSFKPGSDLGILFGDAVKNSLITVLSIGGFIILFSVIINLLIEVGIIQYISLFISALLSPLKVDINIISSVVSGFFEITSGVSMASKSNLILSARQLSAISFIIGWAGLSVHFQVISIVSKTDISIKLYLIGKLLHGIFAAGYTWIGIVVLGFPIDQVKEAFWQHYPSKIINWYPSLIVSCKYLILTLAILGTLLIIFSLFKAMLPRKKT
jgi:sporulation integral membrane protein YlbJ